MKIHKKQELGKLGEQIAVEYLSKNKYQILERNFYCRQGEIDIVAKDKDEIVFVEVKTRSNYNFGRPSEAVDYNKQKHIYRVAKYYLYKRNLLNLFVRFDVIEVLIENGKFNVNHIAIDSLDEIYKLRGSKYVQSEIGESYRQAKTLLDVGKYVLFTGTPCQISGLKSYLKKMP